MSAARHCINLLRLVYRIIVYRIRWKYLGRGRVDVDVSSWISSRATIKGHRGAIIKIGRCCEIHPYVLIISHGGNISIGHSSSVNPFTTIYGIGDVCIGSNVRIATSVTLIPANHIQGTDAIPLTQSGMTKIGIKIEDNVWIGAGSRILDGVTIGRNAVVGANSVVTKDVMPNSVVVGVPARLLM